MGWVLVLCVGLASGGCEIIGFMAYAFERSDPVTVKAEYTGLTGKTVAVLVSCDEGTLYFHPEAPEAVGRWISARLAEDVEGVKVVDPQRVRLFQRERPNWFASSYGQVMRQIGAERLVLIDLVEYTTVEPGNPHVFRGWVSANVGVAEAEGQEPDNLVYSGLVQVRYPPGKREGDLNSDPQRMTAAMNEVFAVKVSRLFHDYEEVSGGD